MTTTRLITFGNGTTALATNCDVQIGSDTGESLSLDMLPEEVANQIKTDRRTARLIRNKEGKVTRLTVGKRSVAVNVYPPEPGDLQSK